MTQGIIVEGLSVRYGHAVALHDVSVAFPPESITGITGPNGAGKSTLLLALRGTVASRGLISVDGRSLESVRSDERVRRIALVPQARQLFPRLTVRENLQVMAGILRLPKGAVDEAVERFPILRQRWRSLAGVLSGGEQQMLALSRALMGRPDYLLLDEPMTGLAPLVVREINDVVAELAASGVGVVVVDPVLRNIAPVMHQGLVLVRGTVAAASNDAEELERAYQNAMGVQEELIDASVESLTHDTASPAAQN